MRLACIKSRHIDMRHARVPPFGFALRPAHHFDAREAFRRGEVQDLLERQFRRYYAEAYVFRGRVHLEMGEDEAATVQALKGHQAEVLPMVGEFASAQAIDVMRVKSPMMVRSAGLQSRLCATPAAGAFSERKATRAMTTAAAQWASSRASRYESSRS